VANKEAYTKEQMIEALRATKGMKTIAARRLGCDYNTVVKAGHGRQHRKHAIKSGAR
jgi:transcriptional regulator of acetoin/glycerol metabolism